MEAVVEQVTVQLKLWGAKIAGLAARAEEAGARARFEDQIYVDELKALHAIALSKLDEFRAAGEAGRAQLEIELEGARSELEAAFKNRKA